jgi:TRAP-type C4-dicarboxylate transport system permease small subunit
MNWNIGILAFALTIVFLFTLIYIDARFGLKKVISITWEVLSVALAFAVCFGLAYGIVAKVFFG